MSIIITNISEHYGESHIQTYSLKINNREICQFKHYRKDGLADCLYQAYLAVGGKSEVRHKDDTICDSDVVATKHKPVVFNGEQYLEFEDWQTVGRFYGVTAKIITTEFVDFGDAKGFLAKAVAIRTDGMEVSAAEAMCLNDEGNWKSKPLFQLRSMAQTRACAKALRNVLAWVVVLAGYRPTPAEEMHEAGNNRPPVAAPQKKAAPTPSEKDGEKNGKTYTVYTIFDENGEKYGTFDTNDTGEIVAIKYVEIYNEATIGAGRRAA